MSINTFFVPLYRKIARKPLEPRLQVHRGKRNMKWFFYIAESRQPDLLTTTLIKRFESYGGAEGYCKKAVDKWRKEGLLANLLYEVAEDVKVVGAHALDEKFKLKHVYRIFATPCFISVGDNEE